MQNFDDSPDVVGRIKLHLFPTENASKIPLTEKEMETLKFVQQVFTIWLSEPTRTDKQMMNFIKSQLGLSEHPARRILIFSKQILGNVQLADRKWNQHIFNESILKAYNRAEAQGNIPLQISAMDKFGKYNKLDKEIAEDLPWDKLIPPVTDFVADPSAAGLRPIENYEVVRSKLMHKFDLAEDIDYTEEDQDGATEE